MDISNIGTINGNPITADVLDSFTETFEQDWQPSNIKIVPTERGKALRALQELEIPLYEIEALEKRAGQKQLSLGYFIHTILRQELIV